MPPYVDRNSNFIDTLPINKSFIVTFQILGENKTFRALVGGNDYPQRHYDSIGAVYYVIAVLMIYGISIVMLILAIVRGRDHHQHLDKQVASYLRNAETIRQQGATATMLKKSLELAIPHGECKLALISECGEPNEQEAESDTGAYYGSESPMPTPRMERRLSRSESNLLTIPNRT